MNKEIQARLGAVQELFGNFPSDVQQEITERFIKGQGLYKDDFMERNNLAEAREEFIDVLNYCALEFLKREALKIPTHSLRVCAGRVKSSILANLMDLENMKNAT